MGEAIEQQPPAPTTPEAAATTTTTGLEACFDKDFLLFMSEDTFSVLSGDAKQGKKEEEEEEALEWLEDKDAFPQFDSSLAFDTSSLSLEALGIDFGAKLETEMVKVPTKRRSPVPRRPRQVFFNFQFLRPGESKRDKQPSVRRRCTHCLVEQTPQWRQGPEGPGTLCNACGVRYKSGRLYDEYRPANSPTFSPGLHSNFHRKVLEMRGGKQNDGVDIWGTKEGRRSRFSGGEWHGGVHAGGGLGT
ncbi:hypothetical protein LUZ61_019183 [Rhynchospora tenuis]|uniref:GATA-type domain-containing protein n=1 Tax=Rhynchospora tenuis TaxID=198213 RepID=A0AAD6EML3_9POAL|nr:hypothetical protein LUZ61_019183 [Rhynchospora tenuis]